jgi:hypothetical protein
VSASDVVPADEDKPGREPRVFASFADDVVKSHGLVIRPETIKSKTPPHPDIVCNVVDHGEIACELAEILDEDGKRIIATMEGARAALLDYPHTLSRSDQLRFYSKFSAKHIKVAFRRARPLRDLVAVLPALYEWLLESVADDTHGYEVPIPIGFAGAIKRLSILVPGPPLIDIAFSLSMADETISAVSRKLRDKQYTATAPIELLAYAHDQPLIDHDTWAPTVAAAIVPMIDASIARGHIRRVWIYSNPERRTERVIKFVCPPLSSSGATEAPSCR